MSVRPIERCLANNSTGYDGNERRRLHQIHETFARCILAGRLPSMHRSYARSFWHHFDKRLQSRLRYIHLGSIRPGSTVDWTSWTLRCFLRWLCLGRCTNRNEFVSKRHLRLKRSCQLVSEVHQYPTWRYHYHYYCRMGESKV